MKSYVSLIALAGIAALVLTAEEPPRCTPVPVDPICLDDAGCGSGEFCVDDGSACESFFACDEGDQCVEVDADCCGCSAGGESTAVNRAWEPEWYDRLECPRYYGCDDVDLCDDSVAACVDGTCRLVPPEPPPPACEVASDCGLDEFCHQGLCASWTACDADTDCVEVPTGCCPCSMGGRSTAISGDWVAEWASSFDCGPDVACLAVYLCQDWRPACVGGHCVLAGGGFVE